MTSLSPHHGGPPPREAPVGPLRLIVTLAGAGALAGGLIVTAFTATKPAIDAHRARRLHHAIQEVLAHPARYDTLYLVGTALSPAPPGAGPGPADRVFRGYRADGTPVGYAVLAQGAGFQDLIQIIFGYDPVTRTILGMKVLESKETPGLGDRIEKDTAFVRQFAGLASPLVGVKQGAGKGRPGEVDMITGATISSRALIAMINQALQRLAPALAGGVASP